MVVNDKIDYHLHIFNAFMTYLFLNFFDFFGLHGLSASCFKSPQISKNVSSVLTEKKKSMYK